MRSHILVLTFLRAKSCSQFTAQVAGLWCKGEPWDSWRAWEERNPPTSCGAAVNPFHGCDCNHVIERGIDWRIVIIAGRLSPFPPHLHLAPPSKAHWEQSSYRPSRNSTSQDARALHSLLRCPEFCFPILWSHWFHCHASPLHSCRMGTVFIPSGIFGAKSLRHRFTRVFLNFCHFIIHGSLFTLGPIPHSSHALKSKGILRANEPRIRLNACKNKIFF